MRMFRAVALGALLLISVPVRAQANTQSDPEHTWLASLSGKWNVTQTLWTEPGKPPKVDRGTARWETILNGRHVRQVLLIDDGTHFEGLGHLGYDNVTKKFYSTWMDVSFPGIVVAKGSYDKGTNSVTLVGTMDQAHERDPVPVREVLQIIGRNHFRYDFYETHHGAESLGVRVEYARAG